MDDSTREDQFRLHQYDQMWRNINRHIFTVWYSVAAVAGAASILALVDGTGKQPDVAATLAIILGTWLLAHIYDAQKWFDRNLTIIQECEDHFGMRPRALAGHEKIRRPNLIAHLAIQRDLGVLIVLGSVAYHLGRHAADAGIVVASGSWTFYLPYAILIVGSVRVARVRASWIRERAKLEQASE